MSKDLLRWPIRNDGPLPQSNHSIATFDRGETMGNQDNCQIGAKSLDGLGNSLFRLMIKGTCGFIKEQHTGLFVESACDADSLPLSTTDSDATLTNKCLITLFGGLNETCNLGLGSCMPHPLHVNQVPGNTKSDVFSNRAVSQINRLRHVRNSCAPFKQSLRVAAIVDVVSIH